VRDYFILSGTRGDDGKQQRTPIAGYGVCSGEQQRIRANVATNVLSDAKAT
jgi:hypothetical protein